MFVGRAVPTAVLGLVVLSPAAAQTPDPIFAGYRFAPEDVGSRPAGLGGAFVAVADETKAAVVNPAGLTLIPITEVALSSGERWARGGDRAKVDPNRRLPDPQRRGHHAVSRFEGLGRRTGGGSSTAAALERGIRSGLESAEPGEPARRSRHDRGRERRGHASALHRRCAPGAHLRAAAVYPALRLGFSYQPGFDWSIPVEASAAPGAPMDVRRPTVFAAGLAFRPPTDGASPSRGPHPLPRGHRDPAAQLGRGRRRLRACPTWSSRASGSSTSRRSGAAAGR